MGLLDKDAIISNNGFSNANAGEIIDAVNNNVKTLLQLPTTIYAVVGDTLQLFYRSMVVHPKGDLLNYRAYCTKGKDFPKYYEYTPGIADVGSYNLNIKIIGIDGAVIAEDNTTIVVVESAQQPASMTNVWCIVASTTTNRPWNPEFERRVTAIGGTPAGDGYGNFFQHVEGNPGWTWGSYVGSSSPFVHNGVLDFQNYASVNGLNAPTVLYIFLTWNGFSSPPTGDAWWDAWDDNVYEFISAAKADYPNIKIKLMSQLYPSLIGGLGDDYGAKGEYYSDSLYLFEVQKRMALIYDRIAHEAAYSSWVEHIECSLQHDAVNNVSNFQKPVNTRNANTELFGDNGLHPSTEGFYQVADAVYRNFIANYCS